MRPWRAFALAAAALAAAASARASGEAGADISAGSNGYRALRARAAFDVGEEGFLTPRAAFFRSDDSPGTFKVFGLRGGWEPGRWTFALDGSVMPRTDGYERSSLGGDAAYAVPLGGDPKETALDLGGGVDFIRHSDEFAAASGGNGRGRGRGAERTEALVIREADLSAFATLRGPPASLNVRVVKSVYDRDPAGAGVRRVIAEGDAFGTALYGFPDSSVSAKLKIKAVKAVQPFAAFTHTAYELGDPPSNALEVGATLRRGPAGLTASVERVRQEGFADRSYVSLGASLEF